MPMRGPQTMRPRPTSAVFDEEPIAEQIEPVFFERDPHRHRQVARSATEIGWTRAAATSPLPPASPSSPHDLDAVERIEGADQHRRRLLLRLGDDVHQAVHAVVEIDVGVAREGRTAVRFWRVRPRAAWQAGSDSPMYASTSTMTPLVTAHAAAAMHEDLAEEVARDVERADGRRTIAEASTGAAGGARGDGRRLVPRRATPADPDPCASGSTSGSAASSADRPSASATPTRMRASGSWTARVNRTVPAAGDLDEIGERLIVELLARQVIDNRIDRSVREQHRGEARGRQHRVVPLGRERPLDGVGAGTSRPGAPALRWRQP